MFYVAKITYYNDEIVPEDTYCIIWASNYGDAAQKIEEDWEDPIAICLNQISFEEDGPYLEISSSLADALINDIPFEIICNKSEYYCRKEKY